MGARPTSGEMGPVSFSDSGKLGPASFLSDSGELGPASFLSDSVNWVPCLFSLTRVNWVPEARPVAPEELSMSWSRGGSYITNPSSHKSGFPTLPPPSPSHDMHSSSGATGRVSGAQLTDQGGFHTGRAASQFFMLASK